MYEEFTQNRIAQLRMQKNVSARDMSLTLGQNNSYINQIENKKALPSLQGLFYICEYFGITPQQFFDDGNAYPVQLADLVEDMKKLDAASLEHIAAIVKEMVGNPNSLMCDARKQGQNGEQPFSVLSSFFCPPLDKVSRSQDSRGTAQGRSPAGQSRTMAESFSRRSDRGRHSFS